MQAAALVNRPSTTMQVLATMLCLCWPCATLKLPKVITSNMVLAAEQPKIFGWASHASSTITVATSDTGEKVSVEARGEDAYFEVELKPRAPSMVPFNITLTEKRYSNIVLVAAGQHYPLVRNIDAVVLTNLLAGDVWICSGQSNMDLSVAEMLGADEIIKNAKHEGLRLFAVKREGSNAELDDIIESQYSDGWVEADPQTVCGARDGEHSDYCVPHCSTATPTSVFRRPSWGYFSAVCFTHGLEVLQATGRPQGLLQTVWGGTIIESWSSATALQQCAGDTGAHNGNNPSDEWNSMVAPLLPIPMRGVVWYQGEDNSDPNKANKYKCQLQALISDWRRRFTPVATNLTWIVVQVGAPGDNSGGALRLSQQAATALPGVGLAVAIDLYDKTAPCGSVHFRNKSAVAQRAARASLNLAYSQINSHWTGPLPHTFTHVSEGVEINFLADGPLKFVPVPGQTQVDALQGFEVTAQASLKTGWVIAPAALLTTTLSVVLNISVLTAELAGIRYGWGPVPHGQFLYDATGLPAGPFLARCDTTGACGLVQGGCVPMLGGVPDGTCAQ